MPRNWRDEEKKDATGLSVQVHFRIKDEYEVARKVEFEVYLRTLVS